MSKIVMQQVGLFILIFLGVASAGLAARKWFLRILNQWAQRTDTVIDNAVVNAIRVSSIFWTIAVGLYPAIGISNLSPQIVTYSFKVLHILVTLSVTLVVANLAACLMVYSIQKAEIPMPTTGLSQTLIKGVVLATGILILLGTLGISITPLLTALGVGGLAVALALQDTLGNLFAGVHLLMEKSIRVGDFVRLENGQEGHVVDIGWRTHGFGYFRTI